MRRQSRGWACRSSLKPVINSKDVHNQHLCANSGQGCLSTHQFQHPDFSEAVLSGIAMYAVHPTEYRAGLVHSIYD
jgi:hypothetical protein